MGYTNNPSSNVILEEGVQVVVGWVSFEFAYRVIKMPGYRSVPEQSQQPAPAGLVTWGLLLPGRYSGHILEFPHHKPASTSWALAKFYIELFLGDRILVSHKQLGWVCIVGQAVHMAQEPAPCFQVKWNDIRLMWNDYEEAIISHQTYPGLTNLSGWSAGAHPRA